MDRKRKKKSDDPFGKKRTSARTSRGFANIGDKIKESFLDNIKKRFGLNK